MLLKPEEFVVVLLSFETDYENEQDGKYPLLPVPLAAVLTFPACGMARSTLRPEPLMSHARPGSLASLHSILWVWRDGSEHSPSEGLRCQRWTTKFDGKQPAEFISGCGPLVQVECSWAKSTKIQGRCSALLLEYLWVMIRL